jgi:hypothetical protein
MTTAVFASTLAGSSESPSKISTRKTSGWMRRILDAMIESRTRAAAIELRRHEAHIADLQRRQEHSPFFLMQDEALPFKV